MKTEGTIRMEPMVNEKIFDLAEQLLALRADKEHLEERLEKLKKYIEEVEYKLSDAMALEEVRNFTRAGMTFYLTTKTYASAVKDIKDDLYSALNERGFGDLVYQTVNANSLSAFVREQIAENNNTLPDWLNGLISIYEKTSVGVRKASK